MEKAGKNKEESENKKYDDYLAARKNLDDTERDTAKQFDKAIITLAAGALALSITFINQIAPTPKPDSIDFLIAAWILFCFSILSTLISFLTSQVACRQARENIDQQYSGNESKATTCINASTLTNVLNYLSIGFFIVGVFSLVTFSSINIKGGKDMNDKKENNVKNIEEGYVLPKLPVSDKLEKGYVPPKPPAKPPAPSTPKDK